MTDEQVAAATDEQIVEWLKGADARRQAWVNRISAMRARIEAEVTFCKRAEEDVQSLREQVETLFEERDREKARADAAEEHNSTLAGQLRGIGDERFEWRKRIAELERELVEVTSKNADLEDRVADLTARLLDSEVSDGHKDCGYAELHKMRCDCGYLQALAARGK